jgi:hypothetical protein
VYVFKNLTCGAWVAIGIAALMLLASTVLCAVAWQAAQPPNAEVVVKVQTPAPVFTLTPTPTNSPTPSPTVPTATATTTSTPRPTATATQVVSSLPNITATFRAAVAATSQAEARKAVGAQLNELASPDLPKHFKTQVTSPIFHTVTDRLVLAHYFAWFNSGSWDDCNISAGDKPLQPYSSDDPAAIARHVRQALEIGLDGFLVHWFAPGDPTDRNFSSMLRAAEGSGFTPTIVFSRHIWHGGGASRQSVADALSYITTHHGSHPNFLRVEDKLVIFFTDVYRIPTTGETPQQFWAAVRDMVDPQRQALWIAEGLDPTYLSVFDGLYVFKISHAAYPYDYQKSSRWAARVRDWEARTGQPKLWLATISPGWDDLRAGCKPDVRIGNTPHRLDRAGGEIYQATFSAAIASGPDWLVVGSFNEWVEGTYIEPGIQYGDKYMQMTADFIRQFRQ